MTEAQLALVDALKQERQQLFIDCQRNQAKIDAQIREMAKACDHRRPDGSLAVNKYRYYGKHCEYCGITLP